MSEAGGKEDDGSDDERERGNSLDIGFDESEPGEGLDAPEETEPDTTVTNTTSMGEDSSDASTSHSETQNSESDTSSGRSETDTGSGSVSPDEIPHRVKADSPKDDREQVNMYLSPEDKNKLRDLKQLAESQFDETVYLIDVYLAALRGSMEKEHQFLDEMEAIGYGYFD
jgi:hypothetical protein